MRLQRCSCRKCNDDGEIRLPAPPAGKAYRLDTDYLVWQPIRSGSSFEVSNFFGNENPARLPSATGKSKKLYEREVAWALAKSVVARNHPALRADLAVALAAFDRLAIKALAR